MKLTGQALADAVAAEYRNRIREVALTERANDGQLWAEYHGGGWITLRGESLPPNKDIPEYAGLSWSLMGTEKSGYWRKWLSEGGTP